MANKFSPHYITDGLSPTAADAKAVLEIRKNLFAGLNDDAEASPFKPALSSKDSRMTSQRLIRTQTFSY